jgi:hypothetical protein
VIDQTDIERLKEIFITRRECDNTTEEINRKLANDSTRLAVIEHQLKTITWLLTAIGGGVITTLIKLFLGA